MVVAARTRTCSRLSLHQRFLNFGNQLLEREGLSEECVLLLTRQVLAERFLGIAGDENDLYVLIAAAKLLEQRGSVHFGHNDIRNHKVDVTVPFKGLNGFKPVAGL